MNRNCQQRRHARRALSARVRTGSVRALALGLLLAGCASIPPPVPTELFRDAAFAPAGERTDADDAFAPSEEMKRFVHVEMRRATHSTQLAKGPQDLVEALYRHDEIKLEYDSSRTRNAAQTFAARRGNCLSLVLMTAALAKEMGLWVTYRSVETDETWSRRDNLAFLSGHVNIDLGRRATNRTSGLDPRDDLVVDFLPAEQLAGQRVHPITEETVVAMYQNNRAAEALARGNVDDAYWWARAAVARAPGFLAPYNTLGVVYLRHGELDAAAAVLGTVLARDEHDREALSNLAIVAERQGRDDEARALRARLARLEPDPPYAYFLRGRQAMQRGDYAAARDLFAREVRRADYNSEFHFWLGLADLRLGRVAEAREELNLAMMNSTTGSDRDLYAAKLERLRSHGFN